MSADSSFLRALEQAEADVLREHLPWAGPLRELHGYIACVLEDLEARVAALEDLVAKPQPMTATSPAADQAKVQATAALLDELQVATDVRVADALAALRAANAKGRDTGLVCAAVRYRKERAATPSSEPTATLKRCTRCGETKPVAEFHRNARERDGLSPWCKTCGNDYQRQWYARRRLRDVESAPGADETSAQDAEASPVADYYGEVSRPVRAREVVIEAGIGVHDGRRIAS